MNITKNHAKFPWLKQYPKGIDWKMKLKKMPLYHLLDKTVAKYPGRNAIDFLGKKYSYKELYDLVNRTAKGLQDLGTVKGTKIGLLLPNSPVFVIFYYAILKIGAIVVNYSPLYAEREISKQVTDSDTAILVTLNVQALYPKAKRVLEKSSLQKLIICPLAKQLPLAKKLFLSIFKSKDIAKINWDKNQINFSQIINNNGNFVPVEINPDKDIAVVQYTGGTTGEPKGALLSHQNIYANMQQANKWYVRNIDKEKILAAIPLFHVFAMTAVMNLSIAVGAEIIMMFPRFDTKSALQMIQKHKITFFPAVPAIFNMICNHEEVKNFDLSSIDVCMSGGAPLPNEIKEKFEELTSCTLIEAYGLSETSPAVCANPIKGMQKKGSIGMPFPETIVKIMSLEEPKKEMPIGKCGEICIAGPQVMRGYLNHDQATKKAIVDGFFYTGDVGYMDKDGYFFIVDRIKDLIISNSYNIYPRVVEEAIYLHDAVEETIVIGIPDTKRGEAVKAFVKIKSNNFLTADDLMEFLRDKLAPLEIPKAIEFRQELPKTVIGKLSKKELVAEEKAKINKDKAPNNY